MRPGVWLILAVSAFLTPAFPAAADSLAVARDALRDGLWDIARNHASKSDSDEAFAIILESYAHEGNWSTIIDLLGSNPARKGDIVSFYRALAVCRTQAPKDALKAIEGIAFEDALFGRKFALLKVETLVKAGNLASARKIIEEHSLASSDEDSKILSAGVYDSLGERAKAVELWREIAASTNAGIAAFSAAARNLGDTNLLKKAYSLADSIGLRRSVGLDLGRRLLLSPDTFGEGDSLIRAIANDSPDAKGAKESFVALADAYLSKEDFVKSADAYKKAIEAWPSLSAEFAVQDGYGWSLLKLGKTNEALNAFSRAEECAPNDASKAEALVKQGDILSSVSRGTEAMQKYRKVLDSYPETPACQKLKTLVELMDLESEGRELYKEFRFSEAFELFDRISAKDPSRKPRMDYLQMLCLYGLGRDSEATLKAKNLAAGCMDTKIRAEATLWLAKFFYNARQWQDSCDLFSSYATNMMPSSAQAPSALLWASRAAFANSDFRSSIDLATRLAVDYPDAPEKASGYLLQGEALVAIARFDEAVVVLEKVAGDAKTPADERFKARMLMADAMFILGADNSSRYAEALEDYRELQATANLTPRQTLIISFKIARTLEKIGSMAQALDTYYSGVILPYRDFRLKGITLDDEVKAIFARAAFRLSDEYGNLGQDEKAKSILRLVIKSDVKVAVDEARRKLDRIKKKGAF